MLVQQAIHDYKSNCPLIISVIYLSLVKTYYKGHINPITILVSKTIPRSNIYTLSKALQQKAIPWTKLWKQLDKNYICTNYVSSCVTYA